MKSVIKRVLAAVLSLALALSFSACSEKFKLVDGAELSESRYRLGDTMGDYTVTDISGKEYSFSEILREKDAIILNFWFLDCQPCMIEFPYLDESYGKYKDKIEVLAINCVGESAEDVEKFAEDSALSLPLAVGESDWATAFGVLGFPTTVVIDRYGKVAYMHTGYLSDTETFDKIFEFFTAEDYEHTVVNSLSEFTDE